MITPRGFRSNPPRSDVNVYAALEFLGLPDKPTRKELDKKYKTLVQANHPDKVSRWTDLQEIATENCKLLSEAYSEIVKTKFNNKK